MGHMRAIDAATTMTDMAGIERAMDYHLRVNHFPPVPSSMVPVCIEAVKVAADFYMYGGENGVEVELPDGVSYRGRDSAPALAIVDGHHLDPFVEAEILRRQGEEE